MGIQTMLFLSAGCIVQSAANFNQCSDSVGACNSPVRASLMQTRSLKAKALSALEASASRAETLNAYKKYVTDLVEKYKTHAQPIEDGSEIDKAIETIVQYIDAMYADLLRWHKADVEDTEHCTTDKVMQSCQDLYLNSTQIQEINTAIEAVQPSRDDHNLCRTKCKACEANAACQAYHHYRKTNASALFEDMVSCAIPQSATLPGHLSDEYIQTNDDQQLEDMESCLEDAKTWLDPLYALYKGCIEDNEFCPTCWSTCQGKQTDFEYKHCQVDIARNTHCSAFRRCYDDKHNDCKDICSDIEMRSNARAADNETGELIKCLLNVLKIPEDLAEGAETKSEKLSACTAPGAYNTSFWDIPCISDGPECPELLHPCDDTDQPCGDSFLDTEYGPLNLKPHDKATYPGSNDMIGECTDCGYIAEDWCPGADNYANFGFDEGELVH